MDDWGERTWTGGGFDVPLAPGRIIADEPATFRATLRWLQLDRVRIEMLTASPHRYEQTRGPESVEVDAVTVIAIGEGDLDVDAEDGPLTMRRGDVAVTDRALPGRYHAATRVRILWSVVAREHVPAHLLSEQPLPAVLPRTPLVNGYVAFLSALLMTRMSEHRAAQTHPYLMQAVIDLQLGVLAERRRSSGPDSGRSLLRRRIEEYVLANLGDPRLDPTGIADALGISLRYAHQVFNREGLTLAAFVRDRRLEAVAGDLRAPESTDLLGELAERHGFHSRDQLTRAFRRRYGVTMSDYREQHHRTAPSIRP